MRIMHVHENYRPQGGAERYLLNTSAALEELGHTLIILSAEGREHLSVAGRREYFVRFGCFRSIRDLSRIEKIIKIENPDVIHLHNIGIFLSPFIIKRLIELKPVVMTMHDVTYFCLNGSKITAPQGKKCDLPLGLNCFKKSCFLSHKRDGVFENIKRIIATFTGLSSLKKIDKIIVSSRFMRDALLVNGFKSDNIAFLPCYTETPELPDDERIANENRLLWVGVMTDERKGCRQFIEALRIITNKDWQATIVGDGKVKESAIALVKKFNLERRVKFTGRLSYDNLDKCYRESDIVVITSMLMESFGLVGLEAMSYGKPVVAFEAGGIPEWLVDGKTGFLVERGDVITLAERISRLLNDRLQALKFGEEGRLRAEMLYGKKVYIDKLINLYKEVIRNRDERII